MAPDINILLECLDGREKAYQNQDFIFQKGENPRWVVVVNDGALELLVPTPEGKEKQIPAKQSVWGIKESILGTTYPWSARARGRVEVREYHCEQFMALIKENPMLKFQLMGLIGKEIVTVNPAFE